MLGDNSPAQATCQGCYTYDRMINLIVALYWVVCLSEFVPHIEKLFDESVLIGNGWTTYESLRFVMYIVRVLCHLGKWIKKG